MAAADAVLEELQGQGQSIWLDNIRRELITSGELAELRDAGVTGITSNPTIFQKAVTGSTDYDQGLVELVRARRKPEQILWQLMVEDLQAAADVFRPVYDRTGGDDGYVSIEVSPVVAHSTAKTVAIARELWGRVDRPNLMVKIPATLDGLPAIRQMIGEGVNINVTLIFSTDRYAQVVEAFLSGLELLRAQGGDLSRVASVASFFVSRVDTNVDRLLQERIGASRDEGERARLDALMGRAGIANSKMAYERFKILHSGERWDRLAQAGARVQRCLWASTSTKDPRYPDTMYVEELIGPDTVDTLPPATLAAIRDHGEVRRSLDADVEGARRTLTLLSAAGIDMHDVTSQLEREGVDSFTRSFEDLLQALTEAAAEVAAGRGPRQWHSLGRAQRAVDAEISGLRRDRLPERIWKRDSSLWSTDAGKTAAIRDRLGWLSVAGEMLARRDEFRRLARDGRRLADVVLLGMGGSSLAPDVLRNTFRPAPGSPRLRVVDTTDPASIEAVRRRLDLERTLFLVSSKSGTTTETRSQFEYFWAEVEAADPRHPGRRFAAITDPQSELASLAAEHEFRWTFLNPPDIGGRYSALSYFGLVPGALIGVDVRGLLERAVEMARRCGPEVAIEKNPGVWLGAVMGALAAGGQDKLTLVMSPRLAALGYWVEQLIAESTGKEGRGILPVEGEPLGDPERYGDDRLFVHTRLDGERTSAAVTALERAGRPVVTITLRDLLDVGGEFFRWEMAVAVAGSILGIDAFDQPNVQESKDNTLAVLEEAGARGGLPEVATTPVGQAEGPLRDLLGRLDAGAYLAVMAYTARSTASERALDGIRGAVRDQRGVATTAGYGPRFLHSTGQFHKGGPPRGVFLQVVDRDRHEVPIPGRSYGFSLLKQAQAIGDYRSLEARGRPVLRVDIGAGGAAGWTRLGAAVRAALGAGPDPGPG